MSIILDFDNYKFWGYSSGIYSIIQHCQWEYAILTFHRGTEHFR